MTDTPNRSPLWEEMRTAYDCSTAPNGTTDDWTERDGFAAEIRALRDWILAELATDPEDEGWGPSNLIELPDLEALLTAEADRAERGDP